MSLVCGNNERLTGWIEAPFNMLIKPVGCRSRMSRHEAFGDDIMLSQTPCDFWENFRSSYMCVNGGITEIGIVKADLY